MFSTILSLMGTRGRVQPSISNVGETHAAHHTGPIGAEADGQPIDGITPAKWRAISALACLRTAPKDMPRCMQVGIPAATVRSQSTTCWGGANGDIPLEEVDVWLAEGTFERLL